VSKRRGNGDGSIYRDGERWVASITVTSSSGRQVRRKRSARTQQQARSKLRELQEELRAGVSPGRWTVGAYLEDWLTHVLPARNPAPGTTDNYTWAVRHHVIPALGAIRLDQLRADDVDRLLRDLIAAGKARSTARICRTVLVMALEHAERRDLVARNVARLSILPPGPVRESRSLTLDQARILLDAIHGERLEAAWVVAMMCGLRPGELLGLPWDAVDLDAGTLRVRQALNRAGGAAFVLGEPKTPKSRRTLDMPAPAVEALRAHRARQAVEHLAAGSAWRDTGLVFTTEIGTVLDPRNFRRAFARATEAAGLGTGWHPHELRHSAVSLLSAAGVRLEDVADVVGHASASRMTGDVYRHQVNPSVSAGKAPMEAMFGGMD